jgi:hypothetical protein
VLAARAVQEHRGAAEETGNIQRYLSWRLRDAEGHSS